MGSPMVFGRLGWPLAPPQHGRPPLGFPSVCICLPWAPISSLLYTLGLPLGILCTLASLGHLLDSLQSWRTESVKLIQKISDTYFYGTCPAIHVTCCHGGSVVRSPLPQELGSGIQESRKLLHMSILYTCMYPNELRPDCRSQHALLFSNVCQHAAPHVYF
jgi:hypothetical protein